MSASAPTRDIERGTAGNTVLLSPICTVLGHDELRGRIQPRGTPAGLLDAIYRVCPDGFDLDVASPG